MMNTLKIHCLYDHGFNNIPYGSSYIRILCPLSHPSVSDRVNLSYDVSLPDNAVDVVIVDRMWKQDISIFKAEELVKNIRKIDATFIYSLDDNLIDLFSNKPWRPYPTNTHRMCVRYFVREADGVIVSTNYLKERLIHLNKNIFVVPNALDDRLFMKRRPKQPVDVYSNEPIKIGYMGTHTHDYDLMMVLYPLRKIMREYKDKIVFEIVGITENVRNIYYLFDGLKVRILDVAGDSIYTKFPGWMYKNMDWDIAIAPLEDTVFTRCKSDLKFLDYSALGIPGIYSNTESYQHTVLHRATGWLCNNNNDDWYDALGEMVNEPVLRQKVALCAHDYVFNKRMLNKWAPNLLDTIRVILSSVDSSKIKELTI